MTADMLIFAAVLILSGIGLFCVGILLRQAFDK